MKRKPNNGKPTKSKLIKEMDTMWSRAVKEKDFYTCLVPGCERADIQSHHIFSRKNHSTRWDLDNGVCLCKGHHLFFAHQEYEKFRDLVIEKMGNKGFLKLKAKAAIIQRWTINDLIIIRQQLKGILQG